MSTHSSDLRVGTRLQRTPVQVSTSSAPAATPSTAASSSSAASNRRSGLGAMLAARWASLGRVSVRGHTVPRWALVGSGVILGAAVAVALTRLFKPRRLLRHSASAAGASSARSGATQVDTATDVGDFLMGDEEGLSDAERAFRKQCTDFLTQVGNAGGGGSGSEDESGVWMQTSLGSVDPELEQQIRAQLPRAQKEFNAASRSLAAHLLLAVNAYKLTKSETEEEFHMLMRKQHSDMLQAWSLLDCSDSSEWEERTLDILRIQVAQCLQHPDKMLPLLERMASRPQGTWNVEESMLLFTVAPLLGKWKDTVRFGNHLRATFPDAAVLSMSSMDYEVISELAAERVAKGGTDEPPEQLLWRQYQIKSQRLKLRTVETDSVDMRNDLQGQFSDPQSGEFVWQALATTPASEVVRCGAIAQLKSFSPAGMALVGPATARTMQVQGRFRMHDGRRRQVESYELRRVEESEMQGADCEPAEEEVETDAEVDADAVDRDDELAALRRRTGGSAAAALAAQAEYWRGTYVMVQEPLPDDDGVASQQQHAAHGHSHGGAPCHGHGGAAGSAGPSLKVTFELEMVLYPRARD